MLAARTTAFLRGVALLTLLIPAGCESMPVQEMSDARQAIMAAKEAGAEEHAAEELLAEMRACPPAPGFERVEIPGERERDHRRNAAGTIAVPEPTWRQILDLAARLGVVPAHRPS